MFFFKYLQLSQVWLDLSFIVFELLNELTIVIGFGVAIFCVFKVFMIKTFQIFILFQREDILFIQRDGLLLSEFDLSVFRVVFAVFNETFPKKFLLTLF